MKFQDIFKRLGKKASENAPGLLIAGGIAGVGITVVMAVKATPGAMLLIDEAKDKKFEQLPEKEQEKLIESGEDIKLTPAEYVKTCWKLYLPVVGVGVGSCSCFVLSHRISIRRQAALLAAYQISQRTLENYQQQVIETVGDRKEREIREESHKKEVDYSDFDERNVINTKYGNYLMYDAMSGHWFRGSINHVESVLNNLTKRVRHEFWIAVNDYNYEVGLPQNLLGRDIGWDLEKLPEGEIEMDFSYGPGPTGNGESCCIVSPAIGCMPKSRYHKFGDL